MEKHRGRATKAKQSLGTGTQQQPGWKTNDRIAVKKTISRSCSKRKESSYMGTRALENRIKSLKEIEEQQKALEEKAEKLKAEIKKEMEAQGTDELHAGNFIVRWKTILSSRFDSKAFSAEHKKLYEQYAKQTVSKRFTIA